MSHELRRPITNIKTLTESLLLGAKNDPDIAGKFLEQINSEVDRLTKLINQLLNLGKIRAGKLSQPKKKINFKEKVDETIKLLKSIADKNVEQYIQNNANISEGAEKIYGLNLADFKSQVLMPQAYKEILQGRMFLNKENFDEWLKNKKSAVRIIILSPDLQWDGSSVKLQ